MIAEKGKVVTISYTLKTSDHTGNITLAEEVNQSQPLVFLFGASGFPEKFEEALYGHTIGNNFGFDCDAKEGYGEKDSEAVVWLAKDLFLEDGKFDDKKFTVGTMVPMSDTDGNILPGKILEIRTSDLLMDFNHPLAGYKLYFSGIILNIREATPEEIAHGHVHGEGGHHH